MLNSNECGKDGTRGEWFATTHWSVVLAAGEISSGEAEGALEKLCQTYWYPLYAYVRRQGYKPHDAQDLTQGFFSEFFVEKSYTRLADPGRGKFRSFLLTALKRYLAKDYTRTNTLKRGGSGVHIQWEEATAEDLYRLYGNQDSSLDKVYDRNWAFTVLEQVRSRLKEEYEHVGRADRYAELERFLPGADAAPTYAEAAQKLGVAEGTIKSDMHRLRQRFGQILREVIADTVATPKEVEDEIRYLIEAIG